MVPKSNILGPNKHWTNIYHKIQSQVWAHGHNGIEFIGKLGPYGPPTLKKKVTFNLCYIGISSSKFTSKFSLFLKLCCSVSGICLKEIIWCSWDVLCTFEQNLGNGPAFCYKVFFVSTFKTLLSSSCTFPPGWPSSMFSEFALG